MKLRACTFIGLIGAMLLIVSGYSRASSWVSINSATESPGTTGTYYTYTYSWPYEESKALVSECQVGCIIGVFYEGGILYNISESGGAGDLLTITAADKCFDMQCIWSRWVAKYGSGSRNSHWATAQQGAKRLCWSFSAFPHSSGAASTGNGVRLPGAGCGMAPPVAVSCNLNNLNDFDFGVIDSKEVDGRELAQSAYLQCNSTVSVDFYLGAGSDILLNGSGSGLMAEVYIDDTKVTNSTYKTLNAQRQPECHAC